MSNLPQKKQETAIASVKSMLQSDAMKNQLAMALPKHMTPERLIRIVVTATQRTPTLLECTPQSLAMSVIQCAELGIEPNLIGEAYLIPYGKQCTMIPGYKGLMKIARNSGDILSIEARAVYEGDEFMFKYGSTQFIEHVPKGETSDDKITHFYALAKLKNGETQFEVMTKSQVDAVRNSSKAGKFGPWKDHYAEMGRKTVVRRLCKYLPASAELSKAVTYDERVDAGLPPISDILFETEAEVVEEKKGTGDKIMSDLGIGSGGSDKDELPFD
jgi:recombination protein RecT